MRRAVGSVTTFAFWCRYPSRPNFGDALTPWMIRKLTGELPLFAWPHDREAKYIWAGSTIAYATATTTVWGAGILSREDRISPHARIAAVRGPLTRERALACGARCPEIFGDPALLLPRFYLPRPSFTPARIGIVPHHFDRPYVEADWRASPGVRLIDIQDPIEAVIDAIAACNLIAASSLHALIVAHAYNVPAIWVEFGRPLLGDGTKFLDYFASVGIDDARPIALDPERLDFAQLATANVREPSIDVEELWECCPLKAR